VKTYQNVFKINLFHTKIITILLTYLLETYHLRLADINIKIKINLEYFFVVQCTFLYIKPGIS